MCEDRGGSGDFTSCFSNNSAERGNTSIDVCSVDNSTLDLVAAVIGTIGIIGNVTFMVVVCRIPYMRNATNYFLISLATSDFLYLLGHTLCREDWYAKSDWINVAGNREILQCVRWGSTTPSYSSSILSVMFISIERYLAICKPFTRQSRGLKKSSRVIILVVSSWLFGAAIGLSGLLRCYMESPSEKVILVVNYAYTVVEVVAFFISLMVVIVLYTIAAKRLKKSTQEIAYSPTNIRDRSQVMRLCIITAAVYFTCIFPRIVFQMAAFYDLLAEHINIFELLSCLNEVTIIILMFNSAVNPIIYNATSTKYRDAFIITVSCLSIEHLGRSSSDRRSFSRTRQTSLDYRQVRTQDSKHRRGKETSLRTRNANRRH